MNKIPPRVIGVVAPLLADHYTHAQLDSLFLSVGFSEDVPEGNKNDKCMAWLRFGNQTLEDPLKTFGELIAEYMELESDESRWQSGDQLKNGQKKLSEAMKRYDLGYVEGGYIIGSSTSQPTKSLGERLAGLKIDALETEYKRAYQDIEAAPAVAVTAACAILESLCKTLLDKNGISLPKKQTLGVLWKQTNKLLGLDPGNQSDQDIKRILSGLISISDGVGALRTHEGSAHGRSGHADSAKPRYRLKARHARLAVHSAHTAALFLLETSAERGLTS